MLYNNDISVYKNTVQSRVYKQARDEKVEKSLSNET